MKKSFENFVVCGVAALVAGGVFAAPQATVPAVVAPYGAVRLTGPMGERLERMLRNDVCKTDVETLVAPFREHAETRGWWQSEFWGKYMHSAVPYWTLTQDADLKRKIDAGVASILAAQEPGGYVGNYPDELRCHRGWDVWGMKYTMLGLIHYYDGTGDQKALAAARRLCDYVIEQIGPGGKRGRPVYKTGNWAGLASCSILEPVVWLYRRTKDEKYWNFAGEIVKQATDAAATDGPRLLDLAQKNVPVADRDMGIQVKGMDQYVVKVCRLKAYEMMSCYQGLIEYDLETRAKNAADGKTAVRDDLLAAALVTAANVVQDEINLAGGCCCHEMWFKGASKQHLPYSRLQETCVTTTWMRFVEKLLETTGDARWADELEKTFYNAYLAAMRLDGSEFAAYTPLNGSRSSGMHHCFMHTNCCNANGPRGFLAILRMLFCGRGDAAEMNFYASGMAEAKIPATGRTVKFETYTLYPKRNFVRLVNHTREPGAFTLALRIPAWSAKTDLRVNGQPAGEPKAGTHFRLTREWKTGDVVEMYFDLAVRRHLLDHAVAYTRGPVALVRATRFADGPLDEPLRTVGKGAAPEFKLVQSDDPAATWMTFDAALPIGSHHENPDEGDLPKHVRFCDYASGADLWRPDDACRMWLPIERNRAE